MLVLWCWMQWRKLMQCFVMADLSQCSSWWCWWRSFNLVPPELPLCLIWSCPHSQGILHTLGSLSSMLSLTSQRNLAIFLSGRSTSLKCQDSKVIENWPNITQGDRILLVFGHSNPMGGLQCQNSSWKWQSETPVQRSLAICTTGKCDMLVGWVVTRTVVNPSMPLGI